VIKIRYADLPGGLHIRAVARGKDTVVYLVPGLTAMQRQAALRRIRSSARMGHGPRLPAAGLAGAVMLDRVRTTVRNAAAAMWAHPTILVPPIVSIASAAIAYMLLVSVSIRVREPQASGSGAAGDPVPAAVAPPALGRPQDPAGRPPGSGRTGRSHPVPGRSRAPAPRPSGGKHPAPGTSPSPSPTPAPTGTHPAPSPSTTPPLRPGSPSASAPSPGGTNSAPPSSRRPDAGGACLIVGPLGVCLAA
jgi:hypothetical protein